MEDQYDIYWYDESETIIHAIYPPQWSWDDFYNIEQVTRRMVKSDTLVDLPRRIDIIADLTNGILPKGSNWRLAKSVMKRGHDDVGLVVVVSLNPFILQAIRLSIRLNAEMGNLYRAASTVEEAVQIIQQERDKLSTN